MITCDPPNTELLRTFTSVGSLHKGISVVALYPNAVVGNQDHLILVVVHGLSAGFHTSTLWSASLVVLTQQQVAARGVVVVPVSGFSFFEQAVRQNIATAVKRVFLFIWLKF